MKTKKSRTVSIIINILIVVCACVLVYSLVNIFIIQKEYRTATNEYEQYQQAAEFNLEELVPPGEEAAIEEVIEPTLYEHVQTLANQNRDFLAWISIPGTNIAYPVVQGADNDYYLDHTFERQSNKSGAIFMDYRNARSLDDTNTIIYGHNMHNGTMFENLNLLLKSGAIQADSRVFLVTTDTVYCYEIFNARQTDVWDGAYELAPDDPGAFVTSMPGGGSFSAGSKILTLSTCTYQVESDLRVVVQARLVGQYALVPESSID